MESVIRNATLVSLQSRELKLFLKEIIPFQKKLIDENRQLISESLNEIAGIPYKVILEYGNIIEEPARQNEPNNKRVSKKEIISNFQSGDPAIKKIIETFDLEPI